MLHLHGQEVQVIGYLATLRIGRVGDPKTTWDRTLLARVEKLGVERNSRCYLDMSWSPGSANHI